MAGSATNYGGSIVLDWLFSGNVYLSLSEEDLLEDARLHAEKLRDRGRRKRDHLDGFVEIPISQLPANERRQMENLFYSGGSFDDE